VGGSTLFSSLVSGSMEPYCGSPTRRVCLPTGRPPKPPSELFDMLWNQVHQASEQLITRCSPTSMKQPGQFMQTEAMFAYWPSNRCCLQFESKEIIYWMMAQPAPTGWGLGLRGQEIGLFPLSYVQLIELVPEEPLQRSRSLRRRLSVTLGANTLEHMDSHAWQAPASELPVCYSSEGTCRERAFAFFEDAESSLAAQTWTKFVMVLIGVSVVAVVVQTMNSLHNRNGDMLRPELWDMLEFAITMIFSFEYLSRLLLVETSRVAHLLHPLNLIDLASITPFYVQVVSEVSEGKTAADGQSWMKVLRVARVFRVLKLSKYSSGLQIFGSALSSAAPALVVQIFLMLTFMIVCAAMFFFAEQGEWNEENSEWLRSDGEASPFDSIPNTFWWATVSMTTVGYGDVFPITSAGKVIATVTMFIGVLSIAMPVSVVTSNFQEQYQLQQGRKQSGGKLTAYLEFRVRYLELRQSILQLHTTLASVQWTARNVDERLEPALQQSRADRILAARTLCNSASKSAGIRTA